MAMSGKGMKLLLSESKIFWVTVLIVLCSLFFALRATGPTDLEGYAQHRNVGYLMDLTVNRNWLAQYDLTGAVISKPPLHTWAMAAFTEVWGVSRTAMLMPSFLAIAALTLLIFITGHRYFGIFTGGLSGLFFVLAPMTSKHIALVRPDAVFALTITGCAFIAFYAWQKGHGWTWFWLVAAAATLAKGPLGVVLAASGLLAYFWEKRDNKELSPPCKWRPGWGVLMFFGLCLGWFLLAWAEHGQVLVDKLILDELIGQAAGTSKDTLPGSNLPKPTMYFISRFAPFSILTFIGLWRVFRRPENVPEKRCFERFLTCWLLFGLVIFSLAAHHRADLLFPLWPAGALIAGREGVVLAGKAGVRRFSWGVAILAVLLFTYAAWVYHPGVNRRANVIELSENVKGAAQALEQADVDFDRLYYFNTPVTLQMYLGTARTLMDADELKAVLAQNEMDRPIYIAVESEKKSSIPVEKDRLDTVFNWGREEDKYFLEVCRVNEE